jgi:hypothetical protein
MPFLTVGGTTVDVSATGSSAERAPKMIGTRARAFNGSLISTERSRKREWEFVTSLVTQATFETLETAVANGAFVDCSGDALSGDTISCRVTITEAGFTTLGSDHRRTLTLLLEEV